MLHKQDNKVICRKRIGGLQELQSRETKISASKINTMKM